MNGSKRDSDEPNARCGAVHMLSFDVEEYFHVEAAAQAGLTPQTWGSFPTRLAGCVDLILQLLDEHGVSATFFVLGWVARNQRGLVRRIADAGHEIATHGMNHKMVGRLTSRQFRSDVLQSSRLLEDICGKPVMGYRAPTFSIGHHTAWALDVLAELGLAYDSSVFPIRHDRYGVPDAPLCAHRAVGPGGCSILEIPPLAVRVLGMNCPVGGGGYLRLLPVRLVGRAIGAAQSAGRAAMLYLHPWEFDPDQPRLPMGRFANWRHRVNLARTGAKLRWLLGRFRFTSVRQCLGSLTQGQEQTYNYGRGNGAKNGATASRTIDATPCGIPKGAEARIKAHG